MITLKERVGDDEEFKEIVDKVDGIDDKMSDVEKEIYQTKNQSRQDPLNFPIRLNNKLAHLSRVVGTGDYKPTDQAVEVKNELSGQIEEQVAKWQKILTEDIEELNKMGQGKVC